MNKETEQVVAGRHYSLPIKDKTGRFFQFESGGQTVFLPSEEAPGKLDPGDSVDLFVYMKGREGMKATTEKPHACLGELAAMQVRSVTNFGVFLDWGIKKDLFVPTKLLRTELQEGDTTVVRLISDVDGLGVIGTCKFDDSFETENIDLKENQEVDCLVFGFNEAGIRVILDGKYKGILYWNEVYEELIVGDQLPAYVKKVRPDGLVDAALQKQRFLEASEEAREIILDALKRSKGFLPLHDKSSPDEIATVLRISKKIFKKTIGGLYRDKIITLETGGIRLMRPEKFSYKDDQRNYQK